MGGGGHFFKKIWGIIRHSREHERYLPCLNLVLVLLLWCLQKIHTKNEEKMKEKNG